MAPQKVVFFFDANMSDFYPVILLLAQHYYGVIELVGIVLETGVVPNIQDGLLLTQQWLNLLNVGTNLDKTDKKFPITVNLYAGLPRPDFLKNRLFPESLTKKIISNLHTFYGLTLPNYNYVLNEFTGLIETGAPSVDVLFAATSNFSDKSIMGITTVQTNSLGIGLDKFPFLSSKMSSIYVNGSNYLAPGNVPADINFQANITLPDPYDDYSGEFNSFMNPPALQRIFLASLDGVDVSVVPLDCSNYTRLDEGTVVELKAISAPFLEFVKDPWVVNINKYFISMMETMLATDKNKQYLWDLCAIIIGLGANMDQYYILGNPVVETSGKLKQYSYTSDNKVKIYMSISYQKCLVNSIRIIFNDPAYKE
jgi:inosine-uridine nucleoside N-ribohydrolase